MKIFLIRFAKIARKLINLLVFLLKLFNRVIKTGAMSLVQLTRSWWNLYIKHPISAILILILLIFIIGLVLRTIKSKPVLVISSFEVPSITSERLKVTGSTVANLFMDEIENIEKEISSIEGLDERFMTHFVEYDKIVARAHPNLNVSVGIEVGGISWDRIKSEWGRIRNKYYRVNGDVVIEPDGLIMRARIANLGNWDVGPYSIDGKGLKKACHALALKLLSVYRPYIAGMYYQINNQHAEARDIYQKWHDREPDSPKPYFYIGVNYWQKSDFSKAIYYLRHAVRIKESFFEAWNNLGIAYYDNLDLPNAIDAYKKALQYNPKYPEALINLGDILLEQKDEEAIDLYQKALELKPDNLDVLIKLGDALLFLNKIEEALVAYEKANIIAMDDYIILSKISNMYEMLGKSAKADGYSKRALIYQPYYNEPTHREIREELKFGNPGGSGVLLIKKSFIISYRSDWKIPAWVIYQLSPGELRGTDIERTDDYRPDTQIPVGQRAELSDYRGSGFDRGHMASPGDFRRNWQAMSECFLLSNIAPQVGIGFNRHIWADLEEAVRGWVEQRGTLTIITGPILELEGDHVSYNVIGENRVAVPTHFFKIIVDANNLERVEALAFIIPNLRHTDRNYEKFLASINDVEAKTGLDFLSVLPINIQEIVESHRASKIW